MSAAPAERAGPSAWEDSCTAARLLALDPSGLGGAWLRARAGPVRDRWLALLRAALPETARLTKVPLHATDERLLGGLDLAATLRAGRPVAERGILAASHGGVVVLPSAERTGAGTAARVAAVLDTGEVSAERDGLTLKSPARLAVVAMDEGIEPDERPPAALADRMAFHIDLAAVAPSEACATSPEPGPEPLPGRPEAVSLREGTLEALCGAAWAYGIDSLRAPILAVRAARAAAALAGRAEVRDEDVALAARLVLAPRATRLPAGESDAEPESEAPPPDTPPEPPEQPDDDERSEPPSALDDLVLAAIAAAIPAGLLAQLRLGPLGRGRSPGASGSGQQGRDRRRGRPAGTLRGEPTRGARLNLVETLRAAAPWQPLRRRSVIEAGNPHAPRVGEHCTDRPALIPPLKGEGESAPADRGGVIPAGQSPPRFEAPLRLGPPLRGEGSARESPPKGLQHEEVGSVRPHPPDSGATRLAIRRDDLRITRFKRRSETTTVFVVDASGSAAFQRLAEAKGAVELLLADCYARRDRVALLSFRGARADLLLPPTRSLARAKRCLAALPGGGGTPLAAAIDEAATLADAIGRSGGTAVLVFLTDGRANVGRDGRGGREGAAADARAAAARLRAGRATTLFIDTSPRPYPPAAEIAAAMGARYLPLPMADAGLLSGVVRREIAGAPPSPGR